MENVSILSYDDKELNLHTNVTLSMPSSVQGGSYFTKIHYTKRPLYMQSPKCISKQGVVSVGKKMYIELVISNEKDSEFISFLENLEKTCIDIIFEKRHIWFTDELEKTDIEAAFASIIKSYKHGTSHVLKLNINNSSHTKHGIGIGGLQTCFVFDEENNTLKFEDVKPETPLITIIEFEGIKFTQKSFQFEMNARQILMIDEKPIFNSCLIKPKKNNEEDESDEKKNDSCGGNVEQIAISVVHEPDVDVTNTEIHCDNEVHSKVKVKEIEEPEYAEIIKNEECLGNLELKQEKEEEVVKDLEINAASENKTVTKTTMGDETQPEKKNEGELELVEINLDAPQEFDAGFEKMKLQNANEVYYKMYKEAKEKAKSAKKIAVEAYLAAEEIKFTYNLVDNESDSDNSDSSDDNNDNGENVSECEENENDDDGKNEKE